MAEQLNVLVAEPDAALQSVVREAIGILPGCHLTLCDGGSPAFEAAQHLPSVDVLVTEAVMQDMDGINLYASLIQANPMMSGVILTEYDLSAYSDYLTGARILPKPFTATGLRDALLELRPDLGMEQTPDLSVTMRGAEPVELDVAERTRPLRATGPAAMSATMPLKRPDGGPPALSQARSLAAQPTGPVRNPAALNATVPLPRPYPAAPGPGAPQSPDRAPPPAVRAPMDGARSDGPAGFPPEPVAPQAPPQGGVMGGYKAAISMGGASDRADPGRATYSDEITRAASSSAAPVDESVFAELGGGGQRPAAFPTPNVGAGGFARPGPGGMDSTFQRSGQGGRRNAGRGSFSSATPDRLNLHQMHPGTHVGNYVLREALGATEWGPSYLAIQGGVNRQVRLTFYSQEHSQHPQSEFVNFFHGLAARPHPNLLTIIEVNQIQGLVFVAEEHWTGMNFYGLLQAHHQLDARTAVSMLEQAISAVAHLGDEPMRLLNAGDLLISPTGVVKIGHLHPQAGAPPVPSGANLAQLSALIQQVLDPGARGEPTLTEFCGQLSSGQMPAEDAFYRANELAIQLAPEAQIEETVEHKEAVAVHKVSSRRQVRAVALITTVVLCVLAAAGYVIYEHLSEQATISEFKMVRVAGGTFVNRNGLEVEVKPFFMDPYEITIGMYAAFLKDVEEKGILEYAPANMPPDKTSYAPHDWENIKACANRKIPFPKFGQILHVNSPVFNIDWWDAAAFARWAQKRLPTADEWEFAARSGGQAKYPWGDDDRTVGVNTAQDYKPEDPLTGGLVDGFNAWNPVNRTASDVTESGIYNLAGNVSEWTSTEGPAKLGLPTRVVMGGSFRTQLRASAMTAEPYLPSDGRHWIGIRLVSDKRIGE